jgi:hypothetical protein
MARGAYRRHDSETPKEPGHGAGGRPKGSGHSGGPKPGPREPKAEPRKAKTPLKKKDTDKGGGRA